MQPCVAPQPDRSRLRRIVWLISLEMTRRYGLSAIGYQLHVSADGRFVVTRPSLVMASCSAQALAPSAISRSSARTRSRDANTLLILSLYMQDPAHHIWGGGDDPQVG